MPITTLDAALAGMQYPREIVKAATGTLVAGRPHSLLYTAGQPGAGIAPVTGLSGAPLTTYPGQIPFTNPAAGKNSYLARLQGQATQAGTLLLCDRLWHNSGLDLTSLAEQVFPAAALIPARDSNGAQVGDGVFAALEVHSLTGAGVPTLTLKYTNTLGADAVAVNVTLTVAASIAGSFYPIGLAAGDVGMQRAQSLTLSASWTSGAAGIVLYRPIARLELTGAQVPNAIDALTGGFPRLFDNTVPFFVFIPNTTTSSNVVAQMIVSQG